MEQLEHVEIPMLEQSLETKHQRHYAETKRLVKNHLDTVHRVTNDQREGFEGSVQELTNLLASVCHLAGEMEESSDDASSTTCGPLRKAGLNMGILWHDGENPPFRVETNIWNREEWNMDWMDAVLKNVIAVPEKKEPEQRRKTSPKYDDDDDYSGDLDYDDDWDEEGYMGDLDMEGNPILEEETTDEEFDEPEQERTFSSPMGMYRNFFYSQAKQIIGQIEELEKMEDEEKIQEMQVDPMSFQMVRNGLSRRIRLIDHGELNAKSAVALIDSLGQHIGNDDLLKVELEKLLIGTIFQSGIGAADFIECQALNVADFSGDTCVSLYTSICANNHPDAMELNDRCQKRLRNEQLECTPNGIDDIKIPNNVKDGYLGFYLANERSPEDPYTSTFKQMEITASTDNELNTLEHQIQQESERRRALKKELDDQKSMIGLGDNLKYGKEGELFTLRDKCFEIQSGKYTYKLCIFDEGFQIEDGRKTSLGKFDGIATDEKTGIRTMKWKNGAKCWNGPHRSATVFLTCGSQTQLLSSDEPQTCEYEFQMESHIGCDDIFKRINNI